MLTTVYNVTQITRYMPCVHSLGEARQLNMHLKVTQTTPYMAYVQAHRLHLTWHTYKHSKDTPQSQLNGSNKT